MKQDLDSSISKRTKEIKRQTKFWKTWLMVVSLMGVIVVSGIGLLLRLSGKAMSHTKQVIDCKETIHIHSAECYQENENGESILICQKVDYVIHTHNEYCYDKNNNLICELPEISMHEHNSECIEVNEDGEEVLICTKLNEVIHMHTAECVKTVEMTDEELAALQENEDETKKADGEDIQEENGFEDMQSDMVYILTYEDDKYLVKVSYHEDANIPENAQLLVSEIDSRKEDYEKIEEETLKLVGSDNSVYTALDIGFYVDGVEIEPKSHVDVMVCFKDNVSGETMTIVHNEESGSSIVDVQAVDEEGQISFTTDSFSIYTFTVSKSQNEDPAEGTYNGYFTYSKNSGENAFLTSAYDQYRNDCGALGQVASSFHLVCFDTLKVNTDLNGNILAKKVDIAPNDWGTRGEKSIWELSYVQEMVNGTTMGSEPERFAGTDINGNRAEHMLVVGSSVSVTAAWDHSSLSVGGSTLEKKDSAVKYVVQDADTNTTPFINLNQVEQEVRRISSEMAQNTTQNVFYDFSDRNNRYIYLTTPDAAGYVNVKASELFSVNNPVRLLGFAPDGKGSLIINVDCQGLSYLPFPMEASIYYDSRYLTDSQGNKRVDQSCYGTRVPTCETIDFTSGRVIWNFYNGEGLYIDSIQQMTGAVIAPGASVSAKNMNGTIIAKNIEITGETHRTDFTGTTIPFAASIYATKTVDGYIPTDADDTFSFELAEWDGTSFRTIQTVKNQGKEVLFKNVVYSPNTDIKTHWYLVSEKPGNNPKYQYDTTCYVIKVVVEQRQNSLHATYERTKISNPGMVKIQNDQIVCDNTAVKEMVFENQITFDNKTIPQVPDTETTYVAVDKKFFLEDEQILDPVVCEADQNAYVKFRLFYSTDQGVTWNTSHFRANVVPVTGDSYTTTDTGTFTLSKACGWGIKIQDLPKNGFDEAGNEFFYQYKVVEGESTLRAFPYAYDFASKQVKYGNEPVVSGGSLEDGSGFAYTINNTVKETTKVKVVKKWLTNGGNEDSISQGANPDACIYLFLYAKGNQGLQKLACFKLTASSITEVDEAYKEVSDPKYEVLKDTRNLWEAYIKDLPKYVVGEDGCLCEITYSLEEAVNGEGYSYGKYVLAEKKIYEQDSIKVYEFTNQSSETYVLPETGGNGTWGYRFLHFFKKLFS